MQKRNTQKLAAVLTTAAMLASSFSFTANAAQTHELSGESVTIQTNCETEVDHYKYIVLANGTVQVERYTGSAEQETIPKEIDGKVVTSIGESAFDYCTSLKSVTIPETVTYIGDYAFHDCTNLTNIRLRISAIMLFMTVRILQT